MNEGIPRNSLSINSINLGVRFLLELAILASLATWGWHRFDGIAGVAAAILLPTISATLWGTFRVPDDPGKATVVIRGWLRLVLEVTLFSLAIFALFDQGSATLGWAMGSVSAIHYIVSVDRIKWLLAR